MSATTESQGSSGGGSPGGEQPSSSNPKEDESARYECNICLDTAKDAVVSMCGHLFCWPCLVKWFDTRPQRQSCPVCKSAISRDKVIPIYGRGGDNTDPREKVPPRPRGQRTEAPQSGFPGFSFGGDSQGTGGVQFSMGIGVFPISFFMGSFWRNNTDERAQPGSRQHVEEDFLNNIWLFLAVAIIGWLLFI
ncbi:unnamed protein product [Auanema sp. JU1783]|nr:unnamed protein product [Auanema sp. JU1783]